MAHRADIRGQTVLPPLALDPSLVLASPRLPAATLGALPLAQRAAAATFPVLLEVPAAAGRLLFARALHALAGHTGPLIAVAGPRPGFAGLPPTAALYVDVLRLAPEAVLALEALLDDGTVWVLAAAEPGCPLPPALAARLASVVLTVPPLHTRGAELPALAADALARLARRAGRAAPRLTAAAEAELAAHAWPGDLTELDAVIAHGLLAARGDAVDAVDLALAVAPAGSPAAQAPVSRAAASGPELEFLLGELAHELRNPMVTIKTYARHLPQMLDDAEVRGRFATLCDEAIERMDGLLENVLAFARLAEPRRQAFELGPLLDRVLADVEPELAGRTVRVQHAGNHQARCAADPEHLAYALRNLFAGVVREVPAREEVTLDAAANGVVTLRFAAGNEAAARLRLLTAPANGAAAEAALLGDPTLLPLSFRLARAVLERNGGTLAVVPDAGQVTTVVVRLPTATAGEP
jgi:signal transduction histidine kinase